MRLALEKREAVPMGAGEAEALIEAGAEDTRISPCFITLIINT